MRLNFETWIKEQNLSENSISLFSESITCYRVGAYRASLIMSYLGFLSCLKDRLLQSEKPDLCDENEWRRLKEGLRKEKTWEEKTFESTQWKKDLDDNKKISKIYLVDNDIIEDLLYWRRKRNECAHAKDSIINHNHVESFWLFIESHLAKFMINGGRNALLDKLKKHFDRNYTELSYDFSYFLENIPRVVRDDDIPDFLEEIHSHVQLPFVFGPGKDQKYRFWQAIAYSTNLQLQSSFIKFIGNDHDRFLAFIETFPDKLVDYLHMTERIRAFWRTDLFKEIFGEALWKVAIILLQSRTIPDAEMSRFVEDLAKKLQSSGEFPSEEQTLDLKRYGFLEKVRNHYITSGTLNVPYRGYDNANRSFRVLIYYLRNADLDIEVVRELNKLFSTYTFGNFFTELDRFINENLLFIKRFREIAEEAGLQLTEFFSKDRSAVESD